MKKQIKLLVMDVDGTLTDGRIYLGSDGTEYKAFNVKDGYAITRMLPELNIIPVILTARVSEIVDRRCSELGIQECYQGCSEKYQQLKKIAEQHHICQNEQGRYSEIAFIGDDKPDLECMMHCGIAACPNDADSCIKEICAFVSQKAGGDGAVRDIVEWMKEAGEENNHK